MKLTEFLSTLSEKKADFSGQQNIVAPDTYTLNSNNLKALEGKLFECEEFKNVVRINYIDLPSYLADEETGDPIAANREFLGGNTKVHSASNYLIRAGEELKLNKIVDLYSVTITKSYPKREDIKKPGVWVYPTFYDPQTFEPRNQIRVIWDPGKLDEALKMVGNSETAKQRLLRMFETALDSIEPNIPCEYSLSIRCSARSIANSENVNLGAEDALETMEPRIPLKERYGFAVISGMTH